MANSAQTVIALLRGINVGGRNRLPMADLRSIGRDLGFGDPTTYLQSGNLVLHDVKVDTGEVSAALTDAIRRVAGLDIPRPLQPAIVRIPLRVTTPTETTLLANSVTFTPGSVAIELSGRDLFVHVLDLRDEAAFRADIDRLETSIIAAFGTRQERSILNSDAE